MALRRPAFRTTSASKMIQRDLHVSSKQGLHPEASNTTCIQKRPIRPPCFTSCVSIKLNARLTFRSIQRDHRVSRQESQVQQMRFASSRRLKAILASSSIRAASSLSNTIACPCFNSTLVKAIVNSTGSTVHQQTNQNSDKF